jgi:pyruvate kinase
LFGWESWTVPDYSVSQATCITGPQLLEQHALKLLGEPAGKRRERIMVTMPSEAAADPGFIRKLLAIGMDVMRINNTHDDQDAWMAMINILHAAGEELGRTCKIYADLAGPKLRTGPISPVGKILKFKPQHDYRGREIKPALVWFTPAEGPKPIPPNVDVSIPVTGRLLAKANVGDTMPRRLSISENIT